MDETDRKVLELQRELQRERDLVEKQRKTIKAQSDTISKGDSDRRSGVKPQEHHQRTVVMNQPPRPPFELAGSTSGQGRAERSVRQDFGHSSLSSPDQGVFRSEGSYQNQTSQPTPKKLSLTDHLARGYNSKQPYHHPTQFHPSYAMAPPLLRPENLLTPTKNAYSAPRTPDPAAMRNGAFTNMTLESFSPIFPRALGPSSTALVRVKGKYSRP